MIARLVEEIRRRLVRARRRAKPSGTTPSPFTPYTDFWDTIARRHQSEGSEYKTIGSASESDYVVTGRVLAAGCRHNGLAEHHRLLDIGCGNGRLAVALHDYLREPGAYYGIDVSPTLIDAAERKLTRANFHFQVSGGLPLPFVPESFDFIVLFSVFTHLYITDVIGYLREVRRLLKLSGICIATVLADPGIPDAQGDIAEMRHNLEFLKTFIAGEGLRLRSAQQAWGAPYVDLPEMMTRPAEPVTRDEGGRQTALVLTR